MKTPVTWSTDRKHVASRHPEQMAAALEYLARRGQTDPGAVHWSYSALYLGPDAHGAISINLRLIGVSGDESVSVHVPDDEWPEDVRLKLSS